MEASALEASLQSFIGDALSIDIAPVPRELELVSEGHIDSMDLVRLAAHLEEVLGIAIPDEDIHDAHFGTVGRMLEYASRRMRAEPGR